jgi:betaine lipid synthase
MASPGGNIAPPDLSPKLLFAGIAGVVFFAVGLSQLSAKQNKNKGERTPGLARSVLLFCYSCFFKPHNGDGKGTQQDALESFYASQAGIYDKTRKTLLKGREDMLALVAAQLQFKAEKSDKEKKRIWVDVCPGLRFPAPSPIPFP